MCLCLCLYLCVSVSALSKRSVTWALGTKPWALCIKADERHNVSLLFLLDINNLKARGIKVKCLYSKYNTGSKRLSPGTTDLSSHTHRKVIVKLISQPSYLHLVTLTIKCHKFRIKSLHGGMWLLDDLLTEIPKAPRWTLVDQEFLKNDFLSHLSGDSDA